MKLISLSKPVRNLSKEIYIKLLKLYTKGIRKRSTTNISLMRPLKWSTIIQVWSYLYFLRRATEYPFSRPCHKLDRRWYYSLIIYTISIHYQSVDKSYVNLLRRPTVSNIRRVTGILMFTTNRVLVRLIFTILSTLPSFYK